MGLENLKDAIRTAGLTSEQFAQIVDVDPKTVQPWVSGRTPYARHRATIARARSHNENDADRNDRRDTNHRASAIETTKPAGNPWVVAG